MLAAAAAARAECANRKAPGEPSGQGGGASWGVARPWPAWGGVTAAEGLNPPQPLRQSDTPPPVLQERSPPAPQPMPPRVAPPVACGGGEGVRGEGDSDWAVNGL
eukprot:scaffold28769_cov67-Isochrysis_galbana.AAC.1